MSGDRNMVRLNSLIASIGVVLLSACTPAPSDAPESVSGLSNAASFAAISDDRERSEALFDEMFKVISHPRCVNCHTADNSPRQGDLMAMHEPPAVRGPAGFGAPGLSCSTCHGSENVEYASSDGSIPGHEVWFMPPLSMAWHEKSASEICAQLKDPTRNGDRTLEDLIEHNLNDDLVGWGWHPGEGRTPAPGTQEMFGELTRAWVDAGAYCPGEGLVGSD